MNPASAECLNRRAGSSPRTQQSTAENATAEHTYGQGIARTVVLGSHVPGEPGREPVVPSVCEVWTCTAERSSTLRFTIRTVLVYAVELLRRTALAEGIHALPEKPVLHSHDGPTVKVTTVSAMLYWLAINHPTRAFV